MSVRLMNRFSLDPMMESAAVRATIDGRTGAVIVPRAVIAWFTGAPGLPLARFGEFFPVLRERIEAAANRAVQRRGAGAENQLTLTLYDLS